MTRKGMKATITVDIFPGRKFSGEISRVYPTIDSDTRTFLVEIIIHNNDEVLRPGMFARVSLDLGKAKVLLLPAITVLKQEGTNDRYIFRADADSLASKIRIKLGERYDDKLEVISEEIREGDRIILAGQDKLLDKSRITVVE